MSAQGSIPTEDLLLAFRLIDEAMVARTITNELAGFRRDMWDLCLDEMDQGITESDRLDFFLFLGTIEDNVAEGPQVLTGHLKAWYDRYRQQADDLVDL